MGRTGLPVVALAKTGGRGKGGYGEFHREIGDALVEFRVDGVRGGELFGEAAHEESGEIVGCRGGLVPRRRRGAIA